MNLNPSLMVDSKVAFRRKVGILQISPRAPLLYFRIVPNKLSSVRYETYGPQIGVGEFKNQTELQYQGLANQRLPSLKCTL